MTDFQTQTPSDMGPLLAALQDLGIGDKDAAGVLFRYGVKTSTMLWDLKQEDFDKMRNEFNLKPVTSRKLMAKLKEEKPAGAPLRRDETTVATASLVPQAVVNAPFDESFELSDAESIDGAEGEGAVLVSPHRQGPPPTAQPAMNGAASGRVDERAGQGEGSGSEAAATVEQAAGDTDPITVHETGPITASSDAEAGEEEEEDDEEEEEEEEEEDREAGARLDDAAVAALDVSDDIRSLFKHISEYVPHPPELPTKLVPFIPEYMPAVGNQDPFLKIPRPDGAADPLGLTVLDEPLYPQSDPECADPPPHPTPPASIPTHASLPPTSSYLLSGECGNMFRTQSAQSHAAAGVPRARGEEVGAGEKQALWREIHAMEELIARHVSSLSDVDRRRLLQQVSRIHNAAAALASPDPPGEQPLSSVSAAADGSSLGTESDGKAETAMREDGACDDEACEDEACAAAGAEAGAPAGMSQ